MAPPLVVLEFPMPLLFLRQTYLPSYVMVLMSPNLTGSCVLEYLRTVGIAIGSTQPTPLKLFFGAIILLSRSTFLLRKRHKMDYFFYLSENNVYLCKETIPPEYILGWHEVREAMPHYDRVKEFELEAGGAALDPSRPLMTETRRVTFTEQTTPLPRSSTNVGLRDVRICKCSGTPTVRLVNICTRCDLQRATPSVSVF